MFNNPYSIYRPSLISRLFGRGVTSGINWTNILNNTQKTLGIINQSITLVYQVKPIVNNAKTMFRIADGLRSTNKVQKKEVIPTSTTSPKVIDSNKPIFYI